MSLNYRAEIDGLRAIAVLSVIFYHGHLSAFSGGYVGVDVFFVISGYLITSIILGDIEAGRFSIRNFYERRIRRILPALYVVMAACVPLAWAFMIPIQIRQFGNSLIAVSLFVSNMLFWKEESYFAPLSAEKPLLHTWSLGIEEQYYLFFPLALSLLWLIGRRPATVVLTAAGVMSLALSEWAWRHAPTSNFYLFPTRAWELLAGSLCAIWLLRRSQPANQTWSVAGLLAILAAIFTFDDATPVPSLYGLLPVGGTALIVLFARADTWVGKLLASRPFVGVGLISYSAYLWHQPLFAFTRLAAQTLPSPLTMFALGLGSLVLGYISWRFIERPFRDRKRFSFAFLVGSGAAIASLFVGLGLLLHGTHGWERAWASQQSPQARQVIALMDHAQHAGRDFGAGANGRQDDGACRFNAESLNAATQQRITACAARFGPGLLILGDSHAIDLFGEVISRASQPFIVGLTKGTCSPHFGDPECPFDALLAFLKRPDPAFARVLYEQAGFPLLANAQQIGSRDIWLAIGQDTQVTGITRDGRRITADVAYVRQLASRVPVVWIGPRLDPMISLRAMMRHGCGYPYRLRPGQQAVYEALDADLASRAAGVPGLTYVSQIKAMQFRFPADLIDCTRSLWQDTDHYSAAGEVEFAKRLPPVWDMPAPKPAPIN